MSRRPIPGERPDPVPSALGGFFTALVVFVLPEPWMWIPGLGLVALGLSPAGRLVVRRAPRSTTALLLTVTVLTFLLSDPPRGWDRAVILPAGLGGCALLAGAWLELRAARGWRLPERRSMGRLGRLLARSPLLFQALLAGPSWLLLTAIAFLGRASGGPFGAGVLGPPFAIALLAAFLWEPGTLRQPATHRRLRSAPRHLRSSSAPR